MRISKLVGSMAAGAALALFTWGTPVRLQAAEPSQDAAKLYDLTLEATPKIAKGKEGKVTVRIAPKGAAEIHKEAPISLSLAGTGVTPGKQKLGRPDMKMDGAQATFEVPFTAVQKGKGTIDATLTFFICTEKVCARQERKATLPVQVD